MFQLVINKHVIFFKHRLLMASFKAQLTLHSGFNVLCSHRFAQNVQLKFSATRYSVLVA